ncbi:hypothetical protein RND81_14G149300 [Saponaria officinalis]|uniref:Uncharacterized protein n=1 Tax=Saponaria officinalis TaxID=3572 RepID=A0AAW1GQZ2_SAPOF
MDDSPVLMRDATRRIIKAIWGPWKKFIITGREYAILRLWEPMTGQEIMLKRNNENAHKGSITSLCLSLDRSHVMTGSLDKSAKVELDGGQDAVNMTMTNHHVGKFEAKFYDKVNWVV